MVYGIPWIYGIWNGYMVYWIYGIWYMEYLGYRKLVQKLNSGVKLHLINRPLKNYIDHFRATLPVIRSFIRTLKNFAFVQKFCVFLSQASLLLREQLLLSFINYRFPVPNDECPSRACAELFVVV